MTVVTWPGQESLGAALADIADRLPPFPDLQSWSDAPLRLVVAPSRAIYDSLTRGRMPAWSAGAAYPDRGAIVLLATADFGALAGALRHEMAHVELRRHVGHSLPLWFEEGFAAVAAQEWGRLEALQLNWQVAKGVRMDLDSLDRALRGGTADAGAAYGLATTAVLLLRRWGGADGLRPLLAQLSAAPNFDDALRRTYHITEGEFELRWQRDLGSRYGWLSWALSVGLFWAVLGIALIGLVAVRRRRDKARRAALDEGWVLPEDEAGSDAPSP